MLIWSLLLACSRVDASWDVFTPVAAPAAPAATPAAAAEPATDPRFAEALELQADAEDPWGTDGAPAEPEAAPAEPEVTPEAAPVAEAAPPAPVEAPAPVGLPSQADWGVRLLNTIPQAQPPRAAIGLPDGTELVVSPGSMLPQVGMVVLAVGPDRVQLARVKAEGDHAVVDTLTLDAQYPGN